MTRLEVERLLPRTQITLRTGPNWTAVIFFLILAALHLFIAGNAMAHRRWEGFMSWVFGGGFALVSLMCWRLRTELALMSDERRMRMRTGFRRLYFEQSVPFDRIRQVRLTLFHPRTPRDAKIELVCDREVIECPPTSVPREEALCLAMSIGVGLTKVYGEAFSPAATRLDDLPADG